MIFETGLSLHFTGLQFSEDRGGLFLPVPFVEFMRYRFSCLNTPQPFNGLCFESQEVFVSIWGRFVGVGRTQRKRGRAKQHLSAGSVPGAK